ncbi:MAG: TetR family transcriptional regulator [Candidatus Gastranaerophilaceae bacterium]
MKNKDNENSKQRILNAATKLFATQGFDGTSIRQICKEANANICMISYFWGGKQELYDGIIEDLVEKQTEYAQSFIDFNIEPKTLDKTAQINLLMTIIDKLIEFFYSDKISKDLLIFLLKAQQNNELANKSPVFIYFRKLIAAIFNKDINSREIILKTVFILSQINSPRILPAFSLSLLGQDDFIKEDIKIIKGNVKLYINTLIKESNIV